MKQKKMNHAARRTFMLMIALIILIIAYGFKNIGSDDASLSGEDTVAEDVVIFAQDKEFAESIGDNQIKQKQKSAGDYNDLASQIFELPFLKNDEPKNVTQAEEPEIQQSWQDNNVETAMIADRPKIAIVIDDLGPGRAMTAETIKLPAPLTLAYLPDVDGIDRYVDQGREKGHEIIVHMPMEAMNKDVSKGATTLRASMSKNQLEDQLAENLSRFDGYIGINNHMGSRLTQDIDAMNTIMSVLKERGLIYLDSRTTPDSVAEEAAQKAGIPFAKRDVFLDHEPTPEFVEGALLKTEKIARQQGYAIAIGHPKEHTINALRNWIPTLEEKGFQIVPLSAVLKNKTVN